MIHTYILKHEYKSEYVNNIINYQNGGIPNIHFWKIFDKYIDPIELNVLKKYIQKKYDNNDYILIIYDNCVIENFKVLLEIFNLYDTVYGKHNNDNIFIKTKIQNLNKENQKINYIYNVDNIL